jgi:hypothetical protein
MSSKPDDDLIVRRYRFVALKVRLFTPPFPFAQMPFPENCSFVKISGDKAVELDNLRVRTSIP